MEYMKKTMIRENQDVDEGYFEFHNTVNQILEEQETLFQTHITSIKEDAMLLSQESELVSNVQGIGFSDFNLDTYVQKMNEIVKKKLQIYNQLNRKLERFQ
jgi:kinesin family member 2/24